VSLVCGYALAEASPVGAHPAPDIAVPAIRPATHQAPAAVRTAAVTGRATGLASDGSIDPATPRGAGAAVTSRGREQLAAHQAAQLDTVATTWLHHAGHGHWLR